MRCRTSSSPCPSCRSAARSIVLPASRAWAADRPPRRPSAIARLGGKALLAARVGDDAAAGMIVAKLQSYGRGLLERAPLRRLRIVGVRGDRRRPRRADDRQPPRFRDADGPVVAACGRRRRCRRGARGHALAGRRARGAARGPRRRAAGCARRRPPDSGRRGAAAGGYARGVLGRRARRLSAASTSPGGHWSRSGASLPGWCCRYRGGRGRVRARAAAGCGGSRHSPCPWSTRSARATSGTARSRWRWPKGRDEAAAMRFASAAAALKVQRGRRARGAPTRAELDDVPRGAARRLIRPSRGAA